MTLAIPVYNPFVSKLPTVMLEANMVLPVKMLPWLITVWREGAEVWIPVKPDPSPNSLEAYRLPVAKMLPSTVRTLEPVSDTYRFDPTSRVWTGNEFEMPTDVVKSTILIQLVLFVFAISNFPLVTDNCENFVTE